MSGKLPALTGAEVIRALGRAGFAVVRIRGSHHFLQHPDGRATVVPAHAGETIGPGLLGKILRDCELVGSSSELCYDEARLVVTFRAGADGG